MYLFDARIVAANGAALADGRFSFLPDADNQVELVIPDGDGVAVEIDERGVHIRLARRVERRSDGFFAAEYADVILTTELVTSRVLGDHSFPRSQEAKWTGSTGHVRISRPQAGEAADSIADENMNLALGSMTLRSNLCRAGLHVTMTGEIGGIIIVGREKSEVGPRGKIEVEFILSSSWIAMRGWPLLWSISPTEGPMSTIARDRSSIDPRSVGSLLLRSPGATPLLVGSMTFDGTEPAVNEAASGDDTQFLMADIYESSINFTQSTKPSFLPSGMVKCVGTGPTAYLTGFGSALWAHIFRESVDGDVELRGANVGNLNHGSGDDIELTQPIEAITASIARSEEGIHLHMEAVVGPLKVEVYGLEPEPDEMPDTSEIVVVRTVTIDALVPMALLIARGLPGRPITFSY